MGNNKLRWTRNYYIDVSFKMEYTNNSIGEHSLISIQRQVIFNEIKTRILVMLYCISNQQKEKNKIINLHLSTRSGVEKYILCPICTSFRHCIFHLTRKRNRNVLILTYLVEKKRTNFV